MKARVPRLLYALLIAYVALTLGYQFTADWSLVVGFFNLRAQVHETGLSIDDYNAAVTKVEGAAKRAGAVPGDVIESVGGQPYTGRSVMQRVRWYAHPGDTMRIGIRKPDGTRETLEIPLTGYTDHPSLGESVFIMALQILMPLACLFLGYWVVLARPADPHAWLILILLSYPEAYISVSTFNWWPPLLTLRLYWHVGLEVIAPVALLWFGLTFPERSIIDTRAPWLKWIALILTAAALAEAWAAEYSSWYNRAFFSSRRPFDAASDSVIDWLTLIGIAIYWIVIFLKLRDASTADNRRRMRVLCAGSVIGLGSALVIWAALPLLGIQPAGIQWLGYLSAILLFAFPFSLAYVVVVQRAMDIRILLRMGTRYALARTSIVLFQFALIMACIFGLVVPFVEKHGERGLTLIVPVFVLAFLLWLNFVKRSPFENLRRSFDRRFFREAYNTEQLLSELAAEARSITDPGALIQTISARISEVLHVPHMAVMLRNGGVFQLQAAGGVYLPVESLPVKHLLATHAPAVLNRDRPEVWFEDSDTEEQRALTELNAEVLLPLTGRNQLMGVMVLGPKLSEEPYSPNDLQLLASIGAQAGLGLEVNELALSLAGEAARLQRAQREVEIAREVQQRLFPEIPVVRGLDIAGHCRPALGVGGDYYDFLSLDDGRLAIALGDVSGKGIAAALLMASLRASLRGLVEAGSHDLARLVRKLNRLVHEASTANRYATFFFAVYDPAAMKLHYVNAGHNPPLILRRDGATQAIAAIRLEACGPVVGLLKDVEYQEAALQLAPGDLFIAYTDGISEAMTLEDEEWGEDRMQAAAELVCNRSAEEILRTLFSGADEFAAGAPQHDDMTLRVLRLDD